MWDFFGKNDFLWVFDQPSPPAPLPDLGEGSGEEMMENKLD